LSVREVEAVRLSIESLNKSFASPVLQDVSLSIRHGEIHAIVGENGAGKSTLVNILAGLLPRDSGNIRLDGLDYNPGNPADGFSSGVSFAAQELSIVGTLSIAENIALRNIPRGRVCIDRKRLHQQARRMLKMIGLDHLAPETIAESLCLADQQLIELAKALSADCRVLILDEPTAALTTSQAERLHTIITDLASSGTSIIYISHRLDDVLNIADTVSVLRDGRVVASVAADRLSLAEIFEMMTGRIHQDTDGASATEHT
jgi:ribose transport system ATP-binding protein